MTFTKTRSPRQTLNSGALFSNKKKQSDKSPDFTGDVVLDKGLTEDILTQYKETGVFKVRLIAYKNTSPEAGVWLKLYAKKDEPRPDRGYQPNKRSEQSEDPFS